MPNLWPSLLAKTVGLTFARETIFLSDSETTLLATATMSPLLTLSLATESASTNLAPTGSPGRISLDLIEYSCTLIRALGESPYPIANLPVPHQLEQPLDITL